MTGTSRNLIVLSDGTGNSASAAFKTNVWRLYQALNLRDGSQVAVFGDGVGTSSVTVLRIIGLAFGVGVKRNVLNLYKFLCHNYWRKDDLTESDRIWMFGFSRGAYTIRVLAGLVHSEGLVKFETEAELDRNAIAAYRAFRKTAFPAKAPWVFWVPLGRWLRDLVISLWQSLTGGVPYEKVERRQDIDIHFVGLWDTVAAYGLPIDELTIAVDKWIWPMRFEDTSLLDTVQHARQALGLDDERRTFHPIPWDERAEKKIQAAQKEKVEPGQKRSVPANRLLQVWFPGMHADVGGGYPDDGLSFVPLLWMIDEAGKQGLKFESTIVETYRALASPTGRIYDSRGGTGLLYRYQPRNVQFLMDKSDDTVPKPERITPLVHHCVVTRMTYGNDGYAPKSLPFRIDILLPNGSPVAFDKRAVDSAIAAATDASTKAVLSDLKVLVDAADAQKDRGNYFALVLDTVWLRRCVYFVTLGLALVALVFPVVYSLMDWRDKTEKINQIESGTVTYLLSLLKGFIPGYASPWIDAVAANPQAAADIVLLFIISLFVSKTLQLRIQDRARAAWNVQPKVGDEKIDRLTLAGQRHAFAAATVMLVIVAAFSLGNWASFSLAAIGAALSAIFVFLRRNKAVKIDPANPPVWLWVARQLRNSKDAVAAYRFAAQTGFPALFILCVAWLALSGVNLGIYEARNTSGAFCEADKGSKTEEERKKLAQNDTLVPPATIDISSPCARTHLWLVAGRQYRIQIEPGMAETAPGKFEKKDEFAWFDRGTPSDVVGFAIDKDHLLGMTLKRWWRESFFQPIARVGNIGNYEYPLHPTAPLPKVDFSACGKAGAPSDKGRPAFESERLKVLACENDHEIKRNPVLIADITPDATGELYIYVNDAVWFWDSREHHTFYRNNSGKAKVTVTRTVAPATVDFNADGQGQPPQRN
jgi:uncharacterized protein (DUF2235 family)